MRFKVLISSTNNAFCHVDWSPVHYQEATHKFWNNKPPPPPSAPSLSEQ
ncbi:hypothetical protein C5167_017817 [Papaver somniferum]|uniref:Uncharacterized protein n=1 Tax=Papaver somniferum TaxID=3469 RepID=A0A4Y7IL00_PAPSO|nr:hypothetical protein C5167_017817 [Papaver somniferum]